MLSVPPGSFPWLEVISPEVRLGHVRHALFDFDGTLSVIRCGWEQVMVPMMIEMICAGRPPTPEIEAEVAEYVDRSTGILTMEQMRWLEAAVQRHGYAKERPSATTYKRIYNEQLLKPVRRRIAGMDGSQAARDSLMLSGARPFLQGLSDHGVTLYLASGTDHAYVMEEAGVLGITDYFGSHIHGARDESDALTKEGIIKRILTENNLQGEALAVIGDGPVEMRAARERGAVALGVAVDEERRDGPAARKRQRLLDAGADLIVTSLTHSAELVALLVGA